MDDLTLSIGFVFATSLIIEAEKLYAEAVRCERRNAPWARNRRRRADKMLDQAREMCGGGTLPWGVKKSDYEQ